MIKKENYTFTPVDSQMFHFDLYILNSYSTNLKKSHFGPWLTRLPSPLSFWGGGGGGGGGGPGGGVYKFVNK
jgi:hypothetical protein